MKQIIAKTLILVFLSGCSSGASSQEKHPVFFKGKIEQISANRLIKKIDEFPEGSVNLHITSTGGNSLFAMKLGDKIRERKVSITVEKYCHSACSHYLLTSAPIVRVKNRASVAFHTSAFFLHIPDRAPQSVKSLKAFAIETERKFFEARGVDYNQWLNLVGQIEPYCWLENEKIPEDRVERYLYKNRYSTVVLSKSLMEQLGIWNIEGEWPQNEAEAIEFARHSGFSNLLTTKFIDRIKDDSTPEIKSLARCQI